MSCLSLSVCVSCQCKHQIDSTINPKLSSSVWIHFSPPRYLLFFFTRTAFNGRDLLLVNHSELPFVTWNLFQIFIQWWYTNSVVCIIFQQWSDRNFSGVDCSLFQTTLHLDRCYNLLSHIYWTILLWYFCFDFRLCVCFGLFAIHAIIGQDAINSTKPISK